MRTLDEILEEYGSRKKRAVDKAVRLFKELAKEGDLDYVADVIDVISELTDVLWEMEEEETEKE